MRPPSGPQSTRSGSSLASSFIGPRQPGTRSAEPLLEGLTNGASEPDTDQPVSLVHAEHGARGAGAFAPVRSPAGRGIGPVTGVGTGARGGLGGVRHDAQGAKGGFAEREQRVGQLDQVAREQRLADTRRSLTFGYKRFRVYPCIHPYVGAAHRMRSSAPARTAAAAAGTQRPCASSQRKSSGQCSHERRERGLSEPTSAPTRPLAPRPNETSIGPLGVR